jgi:hypothetical protein
MLAAFLPTLVTVVLVRATWCGVQGRPGDVRLNAGAAAEHVKEIEVAPGVRARVDRWDDGFTPTCQDLLLVGFRPADARRLGAAKFTWKQIKLQPTSSCDTLGTAQIGKSKQIQEIEVAPGVKVPVDVWEDDHVPTYEELVAVGFLPDDAREFNKQTCTWGEIKICMGTPDKRCDCKKSAG